MNKFHTLSGSTKTLAVLVLATLAALCSAQTFGPIDDAIAAKDFDGFKRLMQGTFTVNSRNEQNNTVIQWVSGSAPVEYVRYLISIGAKFNEPVPVPAGQTYAEMAGYTPLMIAAWGGNLELLKFYQSLGADINYATAGGVTALLEACMQGRLEVVKYLLPLVKDKSGRGTLSYLSMAINHSNPGTTAVAKYLIQSGIDLNTDKDGDYGLTHFAAAGRKPEILKLLLEKQVNWEVKTQWGATPIFEAVKYSLNATRGLLAKKVNLNLVSNFNKYNVLQTAIDAGSPYTVQALIDAGVDPNAPNPMLGKTALQFAQDSGKLYLLPILQKKTRVTMPAWTLEDEIATGLKVSFRNNGALTLADFQGKPSQLSDHRGKVVLLNIWASWCPPCVSEVPSLQALWQKYSSKGVAVLGQNLDESIADASSFIMDNGITFTNYHADFAKTNGAWDNPYNSEGIPTTYIIDRNGLVVDKVVGSRDWSDPAIQRFIDMLTALPALADSAGLASVSAQQPGTPGANSQTPAGQPQNGSGSPSIAIGGSRASGIDAVYNYNNQYLYFFKGGRYFRWDVGSKNTTRSIPRSIAEGWNGLNYAKIDATLDQGDGRLLFFSGDSYLSFDFANNVVVGTPGSLKAWKNMPFTKIDAAYNNGDGKAYLIQGNQYVRVSTSDWSVDPGYPRPLSLYKGLPWSTVDEAFKFNNYVYFFSGDNYVQYDIAANTTAAPRAVLSGFPGVDFNP